MRTFEKFNDSGSPCIICGTKKNTPPVLIPINGTEEDNISEAEQVHLDCINLRMVKESDKIVIYQIVHLEEKK